MRFLNLWSLSHQSSCLLTTLWLQELLTLAQPRCLGSPTRNVFFLFRGHAHFCLIFFILTRSSKMNTASVFLSFCLSVFLSYLSSSHFIVLCWQADTGMKFFELSRVDNYYFNIVWDYYSSGWWPLDVYFFWASVIFNIENAKCLPILAHFDQFWLSRREFAYFLVYFLLG